MDQSDEKLDADILKGREDLLRARRAVDKHAPPPDKSGPSSGKPQDQPQQIGAAPAEPSPLMKAVVDANKPGRTGRQTSDVPSFDVTQKILARERQAAAAKRTAPLRPQTAKAAPRQIGTALPKDQIEQRTPSYNIFIAQIVARDIHRLCQTQSAI